MFKIHLEKLRYIATINNQDFFITPPNNQQFKE